MDMLRILDPEGRLQGDPPLDIDATRELFEAMVTARTFDRKGSSLQRQGRLATYAPFEGQEAAQIGSAAALRPEDWMVASYRDAAAMWFHGYTWQNLFLGRMGDERGGSAPPGVGVLPPSITVGAHMIHAVGLAWAERFRGSDGLAITYFGDGATSEGDFHEAMNFAAVFETPTIFLCQNNQYAISMNRRRQTVSETIAQKASAYGMRGVLVDGNDLFAVYAATKEAAGLARLSGPTLIEAVTYRIGPHTTADDPGRYRDEDEVEEWRAKDPLERVRRYLASEDSWDEGWEEEIARVAAEEIEEAVGDAEGLAAFEPGDVFDAMFATPTSALERQRRSLLEELGEGE